MENAMFDGCAGLLLFLLLPVSIVSFVIARDAQARVRRLEQQIGELRARAAAAPSRTAAASEAPAPPPAERPSEAGFQPPPIEAEPPVSAAAVFDEAPEEVPSTAAAADAFAARSEESVSEGTEDASAVPAADREAPPPAAAARSPRGPIDWESLVGVKLFSWIAAVALALAAVFFLRYSIDHGWLTAPIRMAAGFVVGIALIVISSMKTAGRYRVTANAMDGAGVAILYATTWASHALWHLIPASAAFALMVGTTAIAVVLSIRRDSFFIALLGMAGGFATPAILSTGADEPVPLFTYLLILNAGLAWIAHRKEWPALTAASLTLTGLYQIYWTVRFLDRARVPLAGGIFLTFALLAVATLVLARKKEEPSRFFTRSAGFATILPVLFAAYAAAVPGFGTRYHFLFGFLFVCDAGLGIVAWKRGRELRAVAVASIATILVFTLWFARSWTPAAWPEILLWLAAFVVLFTAGMELLRKLADWARDAAEAPLVAALLFAAFPALMVLEPATRRPWLLLGTAFPLLALVAWSAARTGRTAHYALAAMFLLGAEAVWSSRFLSASTLRQGLLMILLTAALLLILGLVFRDRAVGAGATNARLLAGSMALLLFPALGRASQDALPGVLALAIVIFAGTTFEAIRVGRAGIHRAAAMSSLGLVLLWLFANDPAPLVALLLGGVSVLTLAVLAASWRGARVGESFGSSSWIAMAIHLFLLVVVVRPDLAGARIPIVVTLAFAGIAFPVAAWVLRILPLHLVSAAAAYGILAIWQLGPARADVTPTAVAAGAAGAALMIGWALFAEYRSNPRKPPFEFAAAAFLALFGSQWLGMTGSSLGELRPWTAVALQSTVFVAILILAARWRNHGVALLAVVTAAIVEAAFVFSFTAGPIDGRSVTLAVILFACATIYPIAQGGRAEGRLAPFLVAVFAAVPMFFMGREAMIDWGHRSWIGALPLALALILAGVLAAALRLERRGWRSPGRVATLAAAVLAFVTVAIPLQLEKEWVTVGLALEGLALVGLFLRLKHPGLVAWAGGLFAAVFVRLVLNPAVLDYHARSSTPILNWYLYTYLVAAAAMFVAARLLRKREVPSPWRPLPGALAAAGTIVLFLLLNIEIADFYATGDVLTFDFFHAPLAQELSYTLGWALFAIALLVAGIVGASRQARIAAIALLVLTVFKCFLHDLARLGGLYRVGSFVGLAISLALVALLLQRFAVRPVREE